MRLYYVTRKHLSRVELKKDRKNSLGIVPKGTTKDERLVVKSIQLNGVAHKSHCVGVGDVLVSVYGHDTLGMRRKDFKRLAALSDSVALELEYEIREPRLDSSAVFRLERASVRVRKKDPDSFGFVLRKSGKRSPAEYPVISNVTRTEALNKDFCLRAGDRLIRIDDQDLCWMPLEEISHLLQHKEDALFLVEYSVQIGDPPAPPGVRTELELARLDADLGVVLGSSAQNAAAGLHVVQIKNGSLAHRCGVFHVGDVVTCINGISTTHLSDTDANALVGRFKKHAGNLTFIRGPKIEQNSMTNAKISSVTVTPDTKKLHPILSAVASKQSHLLVPPQNSPESLYNWHFNRAITPLTKTDRKSFDFQSKTLSMLNDVIRNVSTLQQLTPLGYRPYSKSQTKDFDSFPDKSISQQANQNSDRSHCVCSQRVDIASKQAFQSVDIDDVLKRNQKDSYHTYKSAGETSFSSSRATQCLSCQNRNNSPNTEYHLTHNSTFQDGQNISFPKENTCHKTSHRNLKMANCLVNSNDHHIYQSPDKCYAQGSNLAQKAQCRVKPNTDDTFVKVERNRLSQLEAICTETKDSARNIAMHFVKSAINVSSADDIRDVDGGDSSYDSRRKLIREITENINLICTKQFLSKQASDKFLENVSIVDFDCVQCQPLCMSAALAVQKVVLLLTLNDPQLDAVYVINSLLMSALNAEIPCEDCRTPWCSVSQVGRTSSLIEEDGNHSCDMFCHSKKVHLDPFRIGLFQQVNSSNSKNSPIKKLSKPSGVNLNLTDRSAYYSIAPIPTASTSIATGNETMSSLRAEKIIVNTQAIPLVKKNTTNQISFPFSEQFKVPNNSPNCYKSLNCDQMESATSGTNSVTKSETVDKKTISKVVPSVIKFMNGVMEPKTKTSLSATKTEKEVDNTKKTREDSGLNENKVQTLNTKMASIAMTSDNFSISCKEKIHAGKDLDCTPVQHEWKSEGAVSRRSHEDGFAAKLKSVIAKHSSDPIPSGIAKNPKLATRLVKNSKITPVTPEVNGPDCALSPNASSDNNHSNTSLDSLEKPSEPQIFVACLFYKIENTSTMEVNLKNEGKGFGLEIEFLTFPKDGSTMAVIANVEPGTASANCGVLMPGDRLLSLNGSSTAGLSVRAFSALTAAAFAGTAVSLLVEFEVLAPQIASGTFDVCLDKVLKAGLEFKYFTQGGPLLVVGVVKGSAAHRSGQLFAGDEILLTNCIRQEVFESRTCSYTRTDRVLLTVRREEADSDPKPDPNPKQPPSQDPTPSSDVTWGRVQRTSVHVASGSQSLVLEQELVLLRDAIARDFGFLVGRTAEDVRVTGVRPGGPAHRSGLVRKNDRIVEVNGVAVDGDAACLSLLLRAADELRLVTRRTVAARKADSTVLDIP